MQVTKDLDNLFETMLNIVVPMAGRGTRFLKEGYKLPKPLIHILGKPMIQVVINNIKPKTKHRFIFLCLKEHIDTYKIDEKLKEWAPECKIVVVDKVTEGAACTVLLAKKYINNKDSLMIANSDQWIDIDIDEYLAEMDRQKADGLIMTFHASDPKWSYVKLDDKGNVIGTVEKQVVSNEATVGIYNFRHGNDFVESAEEMISKNLRVNNEFYVAPVYNELINKYKKIVIYNIGKELHGMYGLGTPNDLETFIKLKIVKTATNF